MIRLDGMVVRLDEDGTDEGRGPRWAWDDLPRWPGVLRQEPSDRRTALAIWRVQDLDVHGPARCPATVLLDGDGHALTHDLPTCAEPVPMGERESQVTGRGERLPDRWMEAPGADDEDP